VLFINLFQVSTKKTKPRKGNNVSEIKWTICRLLFISRLISKAIMILIISLFIFVCFYVVKLEYTSLVMVCQERQG
jgi:hypothetical protein